MRNPEKICSSPSPSMNVAVAHLRVGSYYEIDHSILTHNSPEQLKSIRLVLVSKITASDVSLRYPSMYSLRSHFDCTTKRTTMTATAAAALLPVFDESHLIPSELAADLLYRRIVPHEIPNSSSFWVSQPRHDATPLGKCCSELRSGGMVKWGKRLRVQYQSRHVKEEEMEEATKQDASRKRKLTDSSTTPKTENNIVVYKRKSDNRKFIDRWCVERYKLAESNMLKVMKEKNAVFGNPILRPALRTEARKLIGDTGLLDHLLKHMAGKVAPGGQDRFRRKHNADGAMEYWLESSDLLHLRKEAGVQDPYWTPPPGWKLGDNPTQHPVCAAEIRDIRQGLASLKREMEKLTSKKEEEGLLVITTPNSCVTSQNDSLMTPAKEIYADLLKKKYKIEDQLVIVAETLRKMEEDMGWLQKTVDEDFPKTADSTKMPFLLDDSPTMQTLEGEAKELNKENQITKSPNLREKGKKDDRQERSPLSLISKSGFKICRPVGSFSWPIMPSLTAATDTASNVEFASSPSHRLSSISPPCPVKPLAAKRPLALPYPFAFTSPEAHTNLYNL